jgi:hypothetical protein
MNNHQQLTNILKIQPQWLMIKRAEWTYLPWALFNCFGSISSENDPTIKALQALLNEDPRILILSTNPKKYYTSNLLDLTIDGFQGKNSDEIIQQIKNLNNWNSQTETFIGRIRPMYGSMEEFFTHYQSILAHYNPSHVILDDKIIIDSEYDSMDKKVFTEQNIKDFYQRIKDLNGLSNIKKFISLETFLQIPSDQLEENNFLFYHKLSNFCDIQCSIELKFRRENRSDIEVNYLVLVGQSFWQTQGLGTFKAYCYHNGLLKLP